LAVLKTVKKLYSDKLEWRPSFFDKLMGTSTVREALERGEPYEQIVASWEPGLAKFAEQRKPFLLYR
jgi:uncharacterized protein YbbC (DUF1343 family)